VYPAKDTVAFTAFFLVAVGSEFADCTVELSFLQAVDVD
jgi:hypothetical protein